MRAGEAFAAWLRNAKPENIATKAGVMTDRYISPVLTVAGVDGGEQWRAYMLAIELDNLPDAADIANELKRIIWE
jgi:hypothetical protein